MTPQDEAWAEAFHLAYLGHGARNQGSVARALVKHREALGEDHVAVRVLGDYLEILETGVGDIEEEDLAEVLANGRRLKLFAEPP